MAELTIDQALQQAIGAHKAGQVQDADRLYTAILKAQPKHPDANHNMGVLAVGVGQVEQALPFFKAALEANPAKTQFWLSYIDALIKLGQLANAKAVLDQARSKGAKGDGFDKLEQRLREVGQEPLEANKIAAETQPKQPNILDSVKLDQAISLAKKKAKDGSLEDARRIYADILTKFPKNKRASYGMKALVGGLSGNVLKVQDPPQDQTQELIDLYSQGQLQQALKQTETLVQQFPKSFILFNIQGTILKELGELGESIKAYNKAVEIKPDFAEAHNNLGFALIEQGKVQEAIEAYSKAIAVKPDYTNAYYGLAASLYIKGDLPSAMINLQHIYSNTSEQNPAHSFMRLPYKVLTRLEDIKSGVAKKLGAGESTINPNEFPLKIERTVEPELIKHLYELSTRSLDDTKDARYGAGRCSPDFNLFASEQPIIKKVYLDLFKLIETALNARILHHESFFNILGAGGGSKPHDHIKTQDRNFDLYKYKYSLVYYLSVGDQNCTEPGILKLYEPDIDILPTKGEGLLIPAIRKHSAIYNGRKDRIMIGCNFYAV